MATAKEIYQTVEAAIGSCRQEWIEQGADLGEHIILTPEDDAYCVEQIDRYSVTDLNAALHDRSITASRESDSIIRTAIERKSR